MGQQYAYFIGTLILGAVWLTFYVLRRDIRREMVWASLVAAPFALTEIFFVPEYWNPPSLFDLIHRFGFGIEDILYSFTFGGIASVVYEFFERQKVVAVSGKHQLHYLPLVVAILSYLTLELLVPQSTILNMTLAFALGATTMGFVRHDLIKQIVFSGLVFSLLYFLLFLIFSALFKDFITTYYTPDFWGGYIFGIPLEEVILAFVGGAFWSTVYEYVKGYRTKPL